MSDLQPPSSPLSDDDVRWLMVRTARSLARLWARLEHFSVQPGRHPMHPLCARDIAPPEPWLEAVVPNTSLSGAIRAVMLAQSLLVDAAVSPEPCKCRASHAHRQLPNLAASSASMWDRARMRDLAWFGQTHLA